MLSKNFCFCALPKELKWILAFRRNESSSSSADCQFAGLWRGVGLGAGVGGDAGAEGSRFGGSGVIGLFGVGRGFGWELERFGTIFLSPDPREGTVERGSGILRGLVSLAAVSIREARRSLTERGGVHRIAIDEICVEVSRGINGPARVNASGTGTTHRSTTGSKERREVGDSGRAILGGPADVTRGDGIGDRSMERAQSHGRVRWSGWSSHQSYRGPSASSRSRMASPVIPGGHMELGGEDRSAEVGTRSGAAVTNC
jgi:hypothetical protein